MAPKARTPRSATNASGAATTGADPHAAAPDREHEIRERAETGFNIAREFGHNFEWAERYIFWWKHLGFRKSLGVFLVFVLPVINAEWTRRLADTMVEAAAEYYGVEVEVGDWDGAFFGAHATARHVVVKAPGPFAKAEIFTADAITVDLSVWRRLRTGHWIKDITVDRPALYLERTLAGRWNWSEIADVVDHPEETGKPTSSPELRRASLRQEPKDDSLRLIADHVELKNMRIQWVENLPGQSGGGIIHSSVATIFVDDAHVRLDNVNVADLPTAFLIEGRTADGKFSVDGKTVPASSGGRATNATVFVENVAMAVFGRIAPQALLVPVDGTMTGNIEFVLDDSRFACRANVEVRNLRVAANRTGVLTPAGADALDRDAVSFRASRRILAGCDGDPRRSEFRFTHAVQTAVTREAAVDGPASIRQAALVDDQRVHGTLATAAVDGLRNELAKRAGVTLAKVFGGSAGAALQQALAPTSGVQPAGQSSAKPDDGNALTRGVKGMGSGLKRLFGGGKKEQKPKSRQPAR